MSTHAIFAPRELRLTTTQSGHVANDVHAFTPPIADEASESSQMWWPMARVILWIVCAMAVGASLVSGIVLNGSLVLLGACVAFSMMLFIGLPLILASISDVSSEH